MARGVSTGVPCIKSAQVFVNEEISRGPAATFLGTLIQQPEMSHFPS